MSSKLQTIQPENSLRQGRQDWARENHGILARIARKCGVTRQWVSQVLYGAPSEDGAIERALAEVGAPGMRERITRGA